MRKKYLKGSCTVEAAVVVTMTVCVLASLVLCAFYIHDRAVFQCAACEAASVGSGFATDSERRRAALGIVQELKGQRLLGSRSLSGNAATGSREVTAVWSAEYPVPGFAARYLGGDSLEIRTSWTCKILDPADAIRKIKGAGELLAGGDS